MKIDRLMAVTIYLLNHGKTSAQKLADAKPGIVSVDFGVAGENQEINARIRLLEEAIRQKK